MRYIGSKARVADLILDVVGPAPASPGFFVDAFCGTGVVAEAAADRGWPIRLNDHLWAAVVMSTARLVTYSQVPFEEFGGYPKALEALHIAKPRHGFIWREYSPASRKFTPHERKYFTEENAARIDGMRRLIAEWKSESRITRIEELLLIADLLSAANRVANIAGTYGCFLSSWLPAARSDLAVHPRSLREISTAIEWHNLDVGDVPIGASDVAYYDPPYTKRQYAAYYHILETITVGDEPTVEGVTGLRPWQAKASDFCYKRRALGAIQSLLSEARTNRVFLSYSSEGHVPLDALRDGLSGLGRVRIHPLAEIGRYRPNEEASARGSRVTEYVIELVKSDAQLSGAA